MTLICLRLLTTQSRGNLGLSIAFQKYTFQLKGLQICKPSNSEKELVAGQAGLGTCTIGEHLIFLKDLIAHRFIDS